MPIITYREALNQAIDEEMARDENVFLMGEEVGEYQGAYKISQGLLEKYGPMRIVDTPIVEEGFTGIGIGAASLGLRPIVEWMTYNFSLVAIDQVISNAAKLRHMSGGQINIPIVFRGPNGPAEYLSSQHSQALESFYAHVPGLQVVYPSNAYDAKGLLKTAIRNDNPVLFLEGELMYSWKEEVPDEEYLIPFGKAEIKKTGKDITFITYGRAINITMKAAEKLMEKNIDAEVIDIRSLRPLDTECIFNSVKKTNRVVCITESWPVASFASYMSHLIQDNCFDYLDAPVKMVSSEDVPMPYNHNMELAVQPSTEKIIEVSKKILYI